MTPLTHKNPPFKVIQILAFDLDRSQGGTSDLGGSYNSQGRFADADQMYARGIALAPDEIASYRLRSLNWLTWKGDLDGARAILEQAPGNETQYLLWAAYDHYSGDYQAALDRLEQAPVSRPEERMGLIAQRGLIHLSLGHVDQSRALLEEAADFFRLRLQEFPEAPSLLSTLGLIEAWLGNKDEAVRLGKRSVELQASDKFAEPGARVSLATIYAWVGEEDHAIDILEELLAHESLKVITRPVLGLQPEWTPLRDNPRFTALID
jgi:tetratricopeptide (TPR) repeat protein